MSILLSQILGNSRITFGTSGARGLVEDFSDEVCAAFTQSFVTALKQEFTFTRVALGIDNRPSSPRMASTCIGMLHAFGLDVDYYGVLPTPALALKSMQDFVPAIMITGSHIPFDRNGIKFYRPDGEISKTDELNILSVNDVLLPFTTIPTDVCSDAVENYINRHLTFFKPNMLSGKHIGIYEHSSAGRDIYFRVFEALGARVTRLLRSDTFVPVDTEAVSQEDRERALKWTNDFHFDAIFTTDGDGDRPLLADEKGHWIRGDIVGLLCAKALDIDALAVPVSCNTAIEQSGFFNKVIRTKIGSPYVIEAFAEFAAEKKFAGFEANGGFMLGSEIAETEKRLKELPTRDALLPVLALLGLAGTEPLSSLVENLPQRYTASDRIQNVPNSWSKTFIADAMNNPQKLLHDLDMPCNLISVDTTDGFRMILDSGDIIHLRASGNAPELRCYAECSSERAANNLVDRVLVAVKSLIQYTDK